MERQRYRRPTREEIESGKREAKFGLGSEHPFEEQTGLPGTLESDPNVRSVTTPKSQGSIFDGLKELGKPPRKTEGKKE